MAIITIDDNGYITSFASGDGVMCDNGIEIDLPEVDIVNNFGAVKYINGNIIIDNDKLNEIKHDARLKELRELREQECYKIVNRGQLWYGTLSLSQLAELTKWYKDWLDVTKTLEIPEKPDWITEG